jgi:hypothetical protein
MDRHARIPETSRRTFLTTTSAALAGVALGGLAFQSAATQRHPKRGGVLQFGTRATRPASTHTTIINCTPAM